MISQSPLLANNPQLQEQMRHMMPQMMQQMQNPEVQQMMTNPQALEAIVQIQQGMERLRQTAPGLLNNLGASEPPADLMPSSITTSTTNTSTTGQSAIPSAQNNPALFSEFMSRMLGNMSSGANPNQPPEERYSSQLDTLASMGFVNREANLQGKSQAQLQN